MPTVRYERAEPGELLHLDVRKLGRILRVGHRITGQRTETHRSAGWEYAHVAIDDTSRVAYARACRRSHQRIAALPRWLHGYRWHRPHASLARQPPA